MPVGQERINHFEIGAKGDWFNRRLTVSVDAFDTVYNNFQVQQFSVIPGAVRVEPRCELVLPDGGGNASG